MADEHIDVEDEDLDFPEDFYKYDVDDYKSVIQGLPNQIKQAYKLVGDEVNFEGEINRIIIAGMGGSAIAGELLSEYLHDSKTPIIINKRYKIPNYADKNTLLIVSSYSGNTEESLSSFKDGLRKGCKIIAISSGGKLEKMAKENRIFHISLPKNLQPRAAMGYSFMPLLRIMENLRICGNKKKEVEHLAKALDKKIFMETGIALSEKLYNTVPIIYSAQSIWPVAYRWKTQLNENSKTMAYLNYFSEHNHNEIEGQGNIVAKFHVVMLRTDKDFHRIKKRMEIVKKQYREKGIDVTDISIKGDTLLTKLFSAMYMGDWTSYFLALRYKTDPTPVHAIEDLKIELGSFIA